MPPFAYTDTLERRGSIVLMTLRAHANMDERIEEKRDAQSVQGALEARVEDARPKARVRGARSRLAFEARVRCVAHSPIRGQAGQAECGCGGDLRCSYRMINSLRVGHFEHCESTCSYQLLLLLRRRRLAAEVLQKRKRGRVTVRGEHRRGGGRVLAAGGDTVGAVAVALQIHVEACGWWKSGADYVVVRGGSA